MGTHRNSGSRLGHFGESLLQMNSADLHPAARRPIHRRLGPATLSTALSHVSVPSLARTKHTGEGLTGGLLVPVREHSVNLVWKDVLKKTTHPCLILLWPHDRGWCDLALSRSAAKKLKAEEV